MLTVSDLNQLLSDITNKYLKRGHVTTRAYLTSKTDIQHAPTSQVSYCIGVD
ncbi:MAG TPA: hypothetical protein GX719_06350 [Gammaproteobacteria bacterium]|nr:hypothetical protein [Gammaproteobacteria bacterium]